MNREAALQRDRQFAARARLGLPQRAGVARGGDPSGRRPAARALVAPGAAWYVAMIAALLMLLAVELFNTGIEKLADHVTREQHPEIGIIKDFGSAAVFCALCLAGLIWLAAIAVRCGLL